MTVTTPVNKQRILELIETIVRGQATEYLTEHGIEPHTFKVAYEPVAGLRVRLKRGLVVDITFGVTHGHSEFEAILAQLPKRIKQLRNTVAIEQLVLIEDRNKWISHCIPKGLERIEANTAYTIETIHKVVVTHRQSGLVITREGPATGESGSFIDLVYNAKSEVTMLSRQLRKLK